MEDREKNELKQNIEGSKKDLGVFLFHVTKCLQNFSNILDCFIYQLCTNKLQKAGAWKWWISKDFSHCVCITLYSFIYFSKEISLQTQRTSIR